MWDPTYFIEFIEVIEVIEAIKAIKAIEVIKAIKAIKVIKVAIKIWATKVWATEVGVNYVPSFIQFFFILKGVDLYDHTKVFLWRTLNYYKPPMLGTLSWIIPVWTSSEYIP